MMEEDPGNYVSSAFSNLQCGFRAFRSTADLLTVLSERIHNSLDVHTETRAIAREISKAFDKVWTVTQAESIYGVGCSIPSLWPCIVFLLTEEL